MSTPSQQAPRPQVLAASQPAVPPLDAPSDVGPPLGQSDVAPKTSSFDPLPEVQAPPGIQLGRLDDGPGAASDACQAVLPFDTYFNNYQRTSMLEIGAPDAWAISGGSADIAIAFIGTGLHVANPDLRNKLWRNVAEVPNGRDDDGNGYVDDVAGWNFAERNGDVNDNMGGTDTQYAGIAAAESNNFDGITGVSWFGRIMVLKSLSWRQYRDATGKPVSAFGGQAQDITEAICYAANNGARVIHLNAILQDSQILSFELERMRQAIEYAYAHGSGAVIVAPAGDCGDAPCIAGGDVNPTILPAAFNRVIGAQAYGPGVLKRANASYGFWVDIAAPGGPLGITYYNPADPRDFARTLASWRSLSGYASAQVAGVAAVILAVNPLLRPGEVERAICRSADRSKEGPYDDLTNDPVDPQPRNDRFGCGALSMEHAVERAPWQVRAQPLSITSITDGVREGVSQTITSLNLNDCAWKLTASEPWIDIAGPHQAKGHPSRTEVSANWERLIQNVGGRGPQAGDRYTATLFACPDNSDQSNWPGPWGDGCQHIPFTLQVIERFFDIYMPSASLF